MTIEYLKGKASGVVGNVPLWEMFPCGNSGKQYGHIPYSYRLGGGGLCPNKWSYIKGKNSRTNLAVVVYIPLDNGELGGIVIHPTRVEVRNFIAGR